MGEFGTKSLGNAVSKIIPIEVQVSGLAKEL